MRLLNQVIRQILNCGKSLLNNRKYFKNTVMMIDPSELLRPESEYAEKDLSKFRDYSVDENDPLKERVRQTYRAMHLNQTVDFVKGK